MLPQFDLRFYSPQIFWLLICLLSLFAVFRRFFVPKIQAGLDERNQLISELSNEIEESIKAASELQSKVEDKKMDINSLASRLKAKLRAENQSLFERQYAEIRVQNAASFDEFRATAEVDFQHLGEIVGESAHAIAQCARKKLEEV